MEKRVLLAIVLSFVVLYGYQAMFPPPEPVKPAPAAQTPATPQGVTAGSPEGAAAPGAAAPSDAAALEQVPSAAPVVSDAAERDVTFENGSVRAIFSTRGGTIKSWRLKKYMNAANQPLELVPQDAPAGLPKPFTLSVAADATVSKTLAQALYRPSASSIDASSAPQTLTFEYQDASGLAVKKEFSFHPDSPYVVHFSASVTRNAESLVPTIHWGPAIGTNLEVNTSGYNAPPQPIYYIDGDVERIAATDVPEIADQKGTYGFAGVDDHYFMSAVVNPTSPLQLQYQVVPVPPKNPAETPPAPYITWSATYAGAPSGAAFFFGPKDFDVLAAIDRDLVRAIHFGMFSWLVVPLLRALKWINVYIGNYGWSIIALTALINVLMFPLRHKSVVSMRRMQEVQPEVKAIQDRYAKLKMTDPARQNQNKEMMQLYKERGVNPASGCVPMLLTLPVLFAFYAMLSVAIELRGAPFIGWIKDLSVYDPLFITPVLMGITQFIQTKMTPSTADPMQQKVMLLMPLMFMFMFIWAPSGLVIYWTVSNLWAIGQQALTNKMIGPAKVHVVRPPAERRVKNAGAGKSIAAKERK
ncbi:MAG TPA: membrane protein insertase YidC [Vicinamibacterales bacterium]|nr:membrane protein insertase YidC [Vicinamibacterales bacterium]